MKDEHDFLPNIGLTNLRRRTVVSVLRAWREIEGMARHVVSNDIRPSVPKEDIPILREQMNLCLKARGGEVTARAHTVDLGRIYLKLNEAGRVKFLEVLAREFKPDIKKIAALANLYSKADTEAEQLDIEIAMRAALITPRSIILRQFTDLPDGFKFLINMREDLLPLVGHDIALKGLEYDLRSILFAWFDIGLLDMVEITWQSPASLLEKLIEYEAVHSVASWDDLKNRLDSDRRVFAFFHNKMPLEPLIFVHVALVEGMSSSVQQLLDEKIPVTDVGRADTAIFYSISNAQKGLAGISFGNFLIKRVVGVLSSEMKNIKTFATLSPIPNFRIWLSSELARKDNELFSAEDREILKLLDTYWHRKKESVAKLKPVLLRLCAHYLLNAKKNGRPLDPVCNFHLSNGSRLERLNWLADISEKGLKQSAGIMANYYYKISDIDENHEEFMTNGKIVASKQVRGYL